MSSYCKLFTSLCKTIYIVDVKLFTSLCKIHCLVLSSLSPHEALPLASRRINQLMVIHVVVWCTPLLLLLVYPPGTCLAAALKVTSWSITLYQLLTNQELRWLIKFTTTFTITSFSSVRLSAIISVRATRVLSAMRLVPSGR